MTYSGGLKVTAELFLENRHRLVNELRKVVGPKSVVVLEGGVERNRYNTDAEDLPFRQVCKLLNFYYILGVLFFLVIWGA